MAATQNSKSVKANNAAALNAIHADAARDAEVKAAAAQAQADADAREAARKEEQLAAARVEAAGIKAKREAEEAAKVAAAEADAARAAAAQALLDAANAAKQAEFLAQAAAPKPVFTKEAEAAARRERLTAAAAAFLEECELPSWQRVIVGGVLGVVLAGCAGWLIGFVAGLLIIAAVALTGWTWIGYVIFALAMIVAWFTGGKVGVTVYGYITDKGIDRHFNTVKSTVGGWFKSKPVVAAPAFTGAHAS